LKLIKLFISHRGRGLHHEVAPLLRFREGDDIPDIVGAGKKHDQSVKAKSDAQVRRGSIFKGLNEEAELGLDIFGAQLQEGEDFLLEFAVVDALRPSGNLMSIKNQVITRGTNAQGVLIKKRDILHMGTGKGMMDRREPMEVLISFE